jgi:hypothetical protein
VAFQKENEEIQRFIRKAKAMRDKKAVKSKRIDDVIDKHVRIHLNSHATRETPRPIAQAIEKPVAADLAKNGVSPIKLSAIAERIRKAGGVNYYKT